MELWVRVGEGLLWSPFPPRGQAVWERLALAREVWPADAIWVPLLTWAYGGEGEALEREAQRLWREEYSEHVPFYLAYAAPRRAPMPQRGRIWAACDHPSLPGARVFLHPVDVRASRVEWRGERHSLADVLRARGDLREHLRATRELGERNRFLMDRLLEPAWRLGLREEVAEVQRAEGEWERAEALRRLWRELARRPEGLGELLSGPPP